MTQPDDTRCARVKQMAAHASEYELGALLKALLEHGFGWQDIRFEGVRELCPGRGELVRSLRIDEQPVRSAVIGLNLGLLSSSSPLPDYFKDFARRLPNPDTFIQFLGFWDSVQLRASAYASFPALSVARSGALPQSYRARVRLASPMTLHSVFRGAFPELGVNVAHAVFSRGNRGSHARMGGALDGRSVIGADFIERSAGFRIQLGAESAACEGVADWEAEALRRIHRLGPWLMRLGKPIAIVLRLDNYLHGHTLGASPSKRRQLGVRPWLRPTRAEQLGPGEVLLVAPYADLLTALPPASAAF